MHSGGMTRIMALCDTEKGVNAWATNWALLNSGRVEQGPSGLPPTYLRAFLSWAFLLELLVFDLFLHTAFCGGQRQV